MKVNPTFDNISDITIDSYIKKCGIQDVDEFISPSGKYIEEWTKYDNMDAGVDLIRKWISRSPIYLLVDCDCDGMMSSAEIYLYLHEINPIVNIVPLFHKGKTHGLDDQDIMIKLLSTDKPALLIIPDASGSEADYEKLVAIGYDILCLDHHQTKPSEFAVTINNQHNEDVNKDGAGAYVVFQFLRALDDAFHVRYANHYIDLCAIGNIGDVMDMTNQYNRTINHFGLNNIWNPFIQMLCDAFIDHEITPHSISWNVVPKINAVIRSDNNELKNNIFYALVGEQDGASVLVECNHCHQKQIRTVNKIAKNIEGDITGDEKVIVVYNAEMPKSYTGLVAGRISGDYNKPCVIIKDDMIGSVRSPIAIRETFNKANSVVWASGHDEACGIKLNDIKKFTDYCDTLDISTDVVYNCIYSGDIQNIPKWMYSYFNDYDSLWGKGISKPQFHIKNIHIKAKNIQTIGRNKTTIKFTYKGIEFIMFFVSKSLKEYFHIDSETNESLRLEVLGELNINSYRDKFTPQVIINRMDMESQLSFDDLW